jgi:hypothetical protein
MNRGECTPRRSPRHVHQRLLVALSHHSSKLRIARPNQKSGRSRAACSASGKRRQHCAFVIRRYCASWVVVDLSLDARFVLPTRLLRPVQGHGVFVRGIFFGVPDEWVDQREMVESQGYLTLPLQIQQHFESLMPQGRFWQPGACALPL